MLVQVVVRGVVVGDAGDTLDGTQEGAQARPVDRRRGGVPILAKGWVDRQGFLGLRRFRFEAWKRNRKGREKVGFDAPVGARTHDKPR